MQIGQSVSFMDGSLRTMKMSLEKGTNTMTLPLITIVKCMTPSLNVIPLLWKEKSLIF